MSLPRRNVSFEKPHEPPFLKAFKAQVGYREPAGIEAKREVPKRPEGDGEEIDKEDEQPTVVVLREGDLGQEEYEEHRRQSKNAAEEEGADGDIPTALPKPCPSVAGDDDDDGKIKFRKPIKRRSQDRLGGGAVGASTTTKKTKVEDSQRGGGVATVVMGGVSRRRRSSSGTESKSKQVKNSSLLSFGDDEEEVGDG